MGMLVDGQWQDVWYDTKATKGRFVRSEAQFRNWSRYVIGAVSTIYLIQGVVLL